MHHFNLSRRLFWVIALFFLIAASLITFYLFKQTEELLEMRAYSRAESLHGYFASMRRIYHRQFLASGIELNASTIGFLPAHAASFINDEFSKHTKDGISIHNVSDRPRNPANKADPYEREAIRYFQANSSARDRLTRIRQNGQEYFFYAAPLKIESYCLRCHGEKENVLPYIADRYDTALGYKEGEVRGITSIKIPYSNLAYQTMSIFWKEVVLSWLILLALLALVYYTFRQVTLRDIRYKQRLKSEVREQTENLNSATLKLKEAVAHQQHLYSILRTVADSSLILNSAQTLDELIDKTARSLIGNNAFLSVKISLLEEGGLRLKSSYGMEEEFCFSPIEHHALAENRSMMVNDFSDASAKHCREQAERYNISAIYTAMLRRDRNADEAFGAMTICTSQPGGFTPEETALIDELAGDLGFAINSFYQKESIILLSYYDPLTTLPNRRLFKEHIEKVLIASARSKRYNGLLLLDLDGFKGVNDLKGHEAGDHLLKEMGERLARTLRQSDTISRWEGDEFAVLVESIDKNRYRSAQAVQQVAQKVLNASKEPFIIDNEPFYLSASIGIVLFSGGKESADELFSHVENAMYAAKNGGKNTTRFYDASLQETMATQAKMIQELRIALESRSLHLVYQEQVDRHGTTVGVEALARWEHPEKGPIPPSQFIPLAEESGVILKLGEWVLEQAVEQIGLWNIDPIKSGWRISVNVSPKQFEQADFIPLLKRLLGASRINPSKLRLELTEGLLIREAEQALEKINELKKMGLSLSIDDFGTGYSSLAYLKHLPIDELKIDQSFVKALPESTSDQTIIRTMISIAEAFGLEVIAEGVETSEQFKTLNALGCKLYQGYLFSRPQKAEYYVEERSKTEGRGN